MKAPKERPVEIGRNYSNLFVQRGGTKVYDDLDEGGGRMTARMPAAGKNIWVEVAVSNTGERYTLVVVETAAVAQQAIGNRPKQQAARFIRTFVGTSTTWPGARVPPATSTSANARR